MHIATEAWRELLRRYANQLFDVFSDNLGALSDTGIDLKASDRIELTIDPYRQGNSSANQESWAGTNNPVPPEIQSALLDSEFIEKWRIEAKPLLVLAPFGCGKSVLLSHFTCRLANLLMVWCDSPSASLPWVPFPVRLRGWQGGITLEEYVEGDAQRHVNSTGKRFWLTAEQIRHLRGAGNLLPLFDGLDELPTTMKSGEVNFDHRAKALSDISLMFSKHHVLSSRPGYGAESKYQTFGTVHELHELDEDAAKQFIRRRLRIPADDVNHPALEQYHLAQPHINELFRRPLFLAAWCASAAISTEHLPMSLSGLMDAVLDHVLDKRIADYRNESCEKIKQDILENRHRLGAVLAIHADVGFGLEVERAITAVGFERHSLALTDETGRQSMQQAHRAGLLLHGMRGTYVQKIPITEYLIGYYYAWLAKNHTEESISPYQRQLVTDFQKRFWWRDYDEIWFYAFDLMWLGSKAQQWMAADLVRWVLNLSRECIDVGNWDAPLLDGQEEDDRSPYSCCRFALGSLLPAGNFSAENEMAATSLVQFAFNQTKDEYERTWTRLQKPGASLERVTQCRPRLVLDWLLGCLKNENYKEAWGQIAYAILGLSAHLSPADVDSLIDLVENRECIDQMFIGGAVRQASAPKGPGDVAIFLDKLKNREYQEVWPWVASAIADATEHLGAGDADLLLECLRNKEYKEAWRSIASAIDRVSAHLGPDDVTLLLDCLKNRDYGRHGDAGELIASAIGGASAHLGPNTVALLLGYLKNVEYKAGWDMIATAVGKTSACPDPEAVTVLISCLKNEEYEEAWDSIVCAVGEAWAHLGPECVALLLGCLTSRRYKNAWFVIAWAIDQVSVHLGPDDITLLLACLKNREYGEAGYDWIACAAGNASTHLGPDAITLFVGCLKNREYQKSWESIAFAIHNISTHLDTPNMALLLDCLKSEEHRESCKWIASALVNESARVAGGQSTFLLGCLQNGEYKEAWKSIASGISQMKQTLETVESAKRIADDAARKGQISYAKRVTNAFPGFIWFVRDVDTKAAQGRKIVYGVAARHDPDLQLNPKFVEGDLLKNLVGMVESRPDGATSFGKAKGDFVRSEIVVDEIKSGMKRFLPDKCKTFETKWNELLKTTRVRRLNDILKLMLREIPRNQRKEFCRRGNKRRGIDALPAKPQAGQASKDEDEATGKWIQVNSAMLYELRIGKRARRLMNDIYDLVVGERLLDDSWRDLENPAFMCPDCGRIFIVSDPSDEEEPRPEAECDVCPHKFGKDDKPKDMPPDVKKCPSNEDMNFATVAPKGKWAYSLRSFSPEYCPCKICKSRKKWRRSIKGR